MRGYFGIGVFHPKWDVNIGTLLRSAKCFGADFLFTIGKRHKKQASDTTRAECHIPLFEYESFEDFRKNLPKGCQLIGVELDKNSKKLNKSYSHPERACYLLGAEDHGIPQQYLSQCHQILEIPDLAHCLNVAVAGSIIMFDRMNKGESNGKL